MIKGLGNITGVVLQMEGERNSITWKDSSVECTSALNGMLSICEVKREKGKDPSCIDCLKLRKQGSD